MISCFIQWTHQFANLFACSQVWLGPMFTKYDSHSTFRFKYSRQCPPQGRKSSDKVVSDCWCIRKTCARCFSATPPTQPSRSQGWEKITFVKLHIKWQTCFHAVLSAYSLKQRMNKSGRGESGKSDFKEQQQKVSRRLAKLSELMQKGKWDLLEIILLSRCASFLEGSLLSKILTLVNDTK